MSDQQPNCGAGGGADTWLGLRIASVFIILVGSISGALFPVLIQNSTWLHVPKSVFEFVFFFFLKINYTNDNNFFFAVLRSILVQA
jgi:hypothetical protein